MPENINEISTKLCLTPEERKQLDDYLNSRGMKLKFFLRQAVIEYLKNNGNRDPE